MAGNRRFLHTPRLVTAAAVATFALALAPASSLAASATLTSPANGATFYTGNGFLAGVPYAATRDLSGCTILPNAALYRIYRSGGPGGLDLPIVQGVADSLNQSVATPIGSFRVYAGFYCGPGANDWIYSQTATINVVAGNPGGGGGSGGGGGGGGAPPGNVPQPVTDSTAPVASSVKVSASGVLSLGGKGIVFRWDSSEPTKATFTIERVDRGVTASRCVKKRRGRRGKACKLYKKVGTLTAPLGTTSLAFNGKLKGRKLKAAKYRGILVLTDAAGNKSQPKRISFRVRRR